MVNNKEKKGMTSICFAGDLSFSRKLQKRYLGDSPIDSRLLDFMNSADAAVINYESPVTSYRDVRNKRSGVVKRLCHRSDPEVLGYISDAFNNPILSFANNHMNDMGDIGILDTMENSEKYGVRYIGIGRSKKEAFSYQIVGEDIKVGLFAVEYKEFVRKRKPFMGPGFASMSDAIKDTIKKIRKKADYAVVVHHGGEEFLTLPDPDKRKLLKSYLDMGADAVVSHHPHVVQGYEYYGNKPVFYSLGNFLFDTDYQRAQEGTDKGLILKLNFSADGIGFETEAVFIDRDSGSAVPGELPASFAELNEAEYNRLWTQEKSRIRQVEQDKDENKDDMRGSAFFRELLEADKLLRLLELNENANAFAEVKDILEARKAFIKNKEKETGIGANTDEHYLAFLIGSELNESAESSYEKMTDICSKAGIDPHVYYQYGLYKLSDEKAAAGAKIISADPDGYYIGYLCGKETGMPAEEAYDRLSKICRLTGVDPVYYYRKQLYGMSEVAAVMKAKSKKRSDIRAEEIVSIISDATGMSADEVTADREKKKANLYDYYYYGLYAVPADECRNAKKKIREIKQLAKKLGAEVYATADVSEEAKNSADNLRAMIGESLSELRIKELTEFDYHRNDSRSAREIAADVVLMQMAWRFFPVEYRMFDFAGKSLGERLSFVSTGLKNDVIDVVNAQEGCDILNDKYRSYECFGDLYGREAVLYDGGPADELIGFAMTKKAFVKKSLFDSMGKGIELVRLPDDPAEKRAAVIRLAEEEYAEHGAFTAEELIDAHESLRKLNPDSVNTVRICTYNDNGRYVVHNSFAKIGRAGSFVDNGGAGGILVNIDKESGVMDSDGIDENCSHYTSHPDTGVTFRGFEYPEWNKALETALKAAAKLPDVRYIGWDLTYTAENKWVIVEGNARTQFLGQQSPAEKGCLDSFAELLGGYEALRLFNNAE